MAAFLTPLKADADKMRELYMEALDLTHPDCNPKPHDVAQLLAKLIDTLTDCC